MSKKKKLPPGVRERDGRFTYRYSVEVVKDGKRVRKQKETKSFPTAKEAYDAGILLEADKLNGRLVDEKNLTLKQWFDRWIEDYEIEREPSGNTIDSRKTGLKSLFKHLGENTRVKDVDGDSYQGWLNKLKKIGRKQGTIKEYHSGAKMFFADAVKKNIIAIDPAAGAKIPAFKQTLEEIESGEELPKFLEKEQLQHLLRIIRFRGTPQDYVIFTTLAYTGLRINELLALKTTDFNDQERTLSITKNLTIKEGGIRNYKLGPPKNKSSIRKVTIGDTVIKAIKNQISWRDKRIEDGEAIHNKDFIFWSVKYPGYPVDYSSVGENLDEYLELAELPESITPHSLRHTHTSLLAASGVDLAVIQERLGHKNDEITRRIYLHVTEEKRKLAPDKFENIMES